MICSKLSSYIYIVNLLSQCTKSLQRNNPLVDSDERCMNAQFPETVNYINTGNGAKKSP